MNTKIMKMHLIGISLVIALDCILISSAQDNSLIVFNTMYKEYISNGANFSCPDEIAVGLRKTVDEFALTLPGFDKWHEELNNQISFFYWVLNNGNADTEKLYALIHAGFWFLYYGDTLTAEARRYRPETPAPISEENFAKSNDLFTVASLLGWTAIFMPLSDIIDRLQTRLPRLVVRDTKNYFRIWKQIHLTRIVEEVNRPGNLEIKKNRSIAERHEMLSRGTAIDMQAFAYEYLEGQENVLKGINDPSVQQIIVQSAENGFHVDRKCRVDRIDSVHAVAYSSWLPGTFDNTKIIEDFPAECTIGTSIDELKENAKSADHGNYPSDYFGTVSHLITFFVSHSPYSIAKPVNVPQISSDASEAILNKLRNLGLTEPNPQEQRNVFSKIIETMENLKVPKMGLNLR